MCVPSVNHISIQALYDYKSISASISQLHSSISIQALYITIEKYTIFQLKSIPVLIVCEDKKSYLNAG